VIDTRLIMFRNEYVKDKLQVTSLNGTIAIIVKIGDIKYS